MNQITDIGLTRTIVQGASLSHSFCGIAGCVCDGNVIAHELFEGSAAVAAVVEGGLDAFKQLNEVEKKKIRCKAIESIRDMCVANNKSGLVAGHYSFWTEGDREPTVAWTESDAEVFTHIIYLSVEGGMLTDFVKNDKTRPDRGGWPAVGPNKWRDHEIFELKKRCEENSRDVMFKTVTGGLDLTLGNVKELIGRSGQTRSPTATR